MVVWLYADETKRFSADLKTLMNSHEWLISPIVRLELSYLHEIGRINPTSDALIEELNKRVGLSICPKPFNEIISIANSVDWTRDPFDRIIVAHASLEDDILITSDKLIRKNYPHAIW